MFRWRRWVVEEEKEEEMEEIGSRGDGKRRRSR